MSKQMEIILDQGKLNEVIIRETRRENGSLRIQQDFTFCPTLAEQHTAHLTDLNYLIAKYKPDELAAYMAARNQYRQEIKGHDFSSEPDLQEAKNITYYMKKNFEALPEEIKIQFKNHVEFLKFIDNPANQEKMIKLGLLKPAEIKGLTDPDTQTENQQTITNTEKQNTKQKQTKQNTETNNSPL